MAWPGINLRANLAPDKVALFGRSSDLSFGPRLGDQERFPSENSVPEEDPGVTLRDGQDSII